MSKGDMTIEDVKDMVNKVLDMNEKDDFVYTVNATFYRDRGPIVSCHVTHRLSEDYRGVQNYKGDMFERIESVKSDMVAHRKEFVAKRKAELHAELAKLEELGG